MAMEGKISPLCLEDEMKTSYLNYAMSVIVGRALPDVRDGLKPVQRRILYAMRDLGLVHNKPHKKSARVTGETLGKYHPHGDTAVYDAMVRMAQKFSLRYPLIDGQGNFGCFTKDTKVKLTNGRNLTFEELIKDNEKGRRNYTFTLNLYTKRIEIAEIKNPRLTIPKAEIIKVTLNNGEEIKCTLNHKFMLRDGIYREAKDLKRGDSLMPTAKRYNHKVVATEILSEREDVYDLTIEGTHNFALAAGVFVHNSIDGDPAAAMRYTEVRLSSISEEMLQDLDKETADFVPNFDNSLKEPSILPAKLPNLLLNGSSGIAVGMATNIPPHNLTELVNGLIKMIENPQISLDKLLEIIKGPDFPTSGIIIGKEGIEKAYKEGRGKIILRGRAALENADGSENIIITELPYQVNKAKLVETIADLSQNGKIRGIKSVRDESDKGGIRIVVELSRGASREVILNQLYKYTPLQVTFGVIILALADGRPELLSLPRAMKLYLDHRKEVVTRRTKFELAKEEKRALILEGFRKALSNLDEVIRVIRSSSSAARATKSLIKLLEISEPQARAILEMRLGRLTRLERDKIEKDYQDSLKTIDKLKSILSSEAKIWATIKEELLEIKKKYGDKRRTIVQEKEEELIFKPEDLIKKEDILITITSQGYIKYTSLRAYNRQNRGGKGVSGIILGERDFVKDLILANTHSILLLFTNLGRVYWAMAYDLPQKKRSAKGRAMVNFLPLREKETVTTVIPVDSLDSDEFLFMVTKRGMVKKTYLSAYSHPQKGGIIGLNLRDKDELIKVMLTSGKQDILLSTKKGKAILFSEMDIHPTGRNSVGVRGIRLKEGDEIIDATTVEENHTLFTITSKGSGKRTPLSKYRKTRRGGKGIINIRLLPHKGEVIGVKKVSEKDEIAVITRKGKSIRLLVRRIPLIGRNTAGSRIIKIKENDEVIAVA